MTTEEALNIAAEIKAQRYDPRHYTTEFAAQQACVALSDALREAQSQTVQMREAMVPRRAGAGHICGGPACRVCDANESALPAPAARTYDDAIRDAAKAIRDQAIRTFGKPTTVANGYAEVVESLLSPAPAVAPVEKPDGCCKGPTPPGGCVMDRNGVCDLAPVAAPKPGPCPLCRNFGETRCPEIHDVIAAREAPKPVAFDAKAAFDFLAHEAGLMGTFRAILVDDLRNLIDGARAVGLGGREP